MRPTQFSADTIIALLRKQTVASLPDVLVALGPRVSRRTAFRKLKDLDARTSYSHRGGYYTLDELADFDERGLWSFAGVRFSRAGTLVATAEAFVQHAEAGHFVDELDNLLHVGTQDALRKLAGDGRLTRHKLAGQFLYCAPDPAQQTHQLRARRLLMATPGLVRPLPDADLMPEELRAAIVLFASLLDERQRRLFAGLESLKCGWGGDRRIATLLGIDSSTVAAGRRQLVDRDVEVDRVRRAGGGRRVNHKKLAGASHPNRDQQFRYITELRERCAADSIPVISVDTKKKELVGAFRNPGAKWDRSPELVNDHDFPSDAEGLAIPYGIYDPRRGRNHYPQAQSLQILAEAATVPRRAPGSSTCTPAKPATSKWNPIEHRLFCEISKNSGRPLDSYETRHPPDCVCPHLVRKTYKTGVKVTDAQMRELRITPRLPRSRGQVKAFGSRHGVYININSCGRCGSRAQRGIQRTCGRP